MPSPSAAPAAMRWSFGRWQWITSGFIFWSSGRNARRVVFGALNLRTGTRLFVPREKGRSVDFQAFVEEVRSAYRGWHVALLLDEDPCHTAKASQQQLEGMKNVIAKAKTYLEDMDLCEVRECGICDEDLKSATSALELALHGPTPPKSDRPLEQGKV